MMKLLIFHACYDPDPEFIVEDLTPINIVDYLIAFNSALLSRL